jgi:hypothetical protein
MFPRAGLAIALALGVWACGCASSAVSTHNKSPLAPFKPSLETSALEVMFVRHSYELPALNEELWRGVDETAIPAEVRRALVRNGLRAGIISGVLTPALESALIGQSQAAVPTSQSHTHRGTAGQLERAPFVSRRTVHALAGQRSEFLASGVYERLPLLIRDGGEARGKTYDKAQCVVAATATPLGDERVRIAIVPEVQYGDPRQQFRGGEDGMWRIDAARPRVALDNMAFDVVLSPGQAVVLASRTDRPGSAGHYFFTEPVDGQLEQKLMLIRFDGTKYDSLLSKELP